MPRQPNSTTGPRKLTALRLPPDILARLDAFIRGQRMPLSRTSVMELAVREFLEREEQAQPTMKQG